MSKKATTRANKGVFVHENGGASHFELILTAFRLQFQNEVRGGYEQLKLMNRIGRALDSVSVETPKSPITCPRCNAEVRPGDTAARELDDGEQIVLMAPMEWEKLRSIVKGSIPWGSVQGADAEEMIEFFCSWPEVKVSEDGEEVAST